MNRRYTARLQFASTLFALFLLSGCTVFDFGMQPAPSRPTTSPVPTEAQISLGSQRVQPFAAGSKEQFEFLSQQRSSTCSLQPQTVAGYDDEQRIQGACCSPMELHRYQEQVAELARYADVPQIPVDPYDIPAGLAQELFAYQQTITLGDKQQAIYDRAMTLSAEGGPCCCTCWRWHAFEGQAKYLITQHNWTAEQIAQLWEIEDGCGGAEHSGEHETS